jgi:O-antigen ligase
MIAAPAVAAPLLLAAFLVALLRPTIPNPFLLAPAPAWTVVCYAFALPILLYHFVRGERWQMTPFDYALCAYLTVVLATWPASVNHRSTGAAVVTLAAQVAVFGAVRLLIARWPPAARIVVAGLVCGIAVLQWLATDYHLRNGLSFRLTEFPLEWDGRPGLGAVGAIGFALLIGIWQRARSITLQGASILLIVGAVVELIFFYSRDPWVAAAAVLVLAFGVAFRIGGIRRFALAAGIIVAVTAFANTPYTTSLVRMMVGLEHGPEGGLALRLGAWRDASAMIRAHGMTGVGLGNYLAARRATDLPRFAMIPAEQTPLVHPHNLFLQQMAETGVAGGLAYLAMWATALWAGWRVSTDRTQTFDANLGVFYALAAIAIVNVGENIFLDAVAGARVRIHTIAWVLMAVAIGEWERRRNVEPASLRDAA